MLQILTLLLLLWSELKLPAIRSPPSRSGCCTRSLLIVCSGEQLRCTRCLLIACSGGFAAIRMYSYKLARPLMATPPCASSALLMRRVSCRITIISFFRVEILAFLNLVRTSSSGHAETISLLAHLQRRDCGLSVSGDFARHGGGVGEPFFRVKRRKLQSRVVLESGVKFLFEKYHGKVSTGASKLG